MKNMNFINCFIFLIVICVSSPPLYSREEQYLKPFAKKTAPNSSIYEKTTTQQKLIRATLDPNIRIKNNYFVRPKGTYENRLIIKFVNHIPIRIDNSFKKLEVAQLQLFENDLMFNNSDSTIDQTVDLKLPNPEDLYLQKRISDPSQSLSAVISTKKLVFDGAHQTERDKQKMLVEGPVLGVVSQQLIEVNNLFKDPRVTSWKRLFSRSSTDLMIERSNAEKNSGRELADLTNYFVLTFNNETSALDFKTQLSNLVIINTVYFPPVPHNSDIAPPTPSFEGNQGYLESAAISNGVDARYAWGFNGGRGELVRIIDIEGGWNDDHEDLPDPFYTSGVNFWGQNTRNHGTAVLGTIVGIDDGSGITGIANQAQFGFASVLNGLAVQFNPDLALANVASAISSSTSNLDAGDIILIEQHARGPGSDSSCPATCGNCDQWRFIAMEYWQAEFEAIEIATSLGIVVVEAAGNGGQNLDSVRYASRFNRNQRDSGAIFVGAGTSNNRTPICWSNFGTRLDVQGWGQNVRTAGYGDITVFGAEDDENQWYTNNFSGTSSASPMVVGTAAILQGIQKAMGNLPWTPNEIRTLLVNNGNAQSGTRLIGPLPDLRNTLDSLDITPNNQDSQSNEISIDGSCTSSAEFSGECGGNACVNKPAGMVGGGCFLGIPLFCEESYMIYHTDQFICAD